jgi:hypothetical protein
MTGRPIVGFLYSFIFLLFIVQSGNGQVTLSVSKRNLGIEKAQNLFEAGQYDLAKLEIEGLLKNDENISRLCLIEKWSRIGAIEIVVGGTFSKNTYETVSNLPISDYQLFTKRVQELITLSNNLTSQEYNSKTELPGT